MGVANRQPSQSGVVSVLSPRGMSRGQLFQVLIPSEVDRSPRVGRLGHVGSTSGHGQHSNDLACGMCNNSNVLLVVSVFDRKF